MKLKSVWQYAMERAGDHFGVIGPHGGDIDEAALLANGSKPMGIVYRHRGDDRSPAQAVLQAAVDDGRLVRHTVDLGDTVDPSRALAIYYAPQVHETAQAYIAAYDRLYNQDGPLETAQRDIVTLESSVAKQKAAPPNTLRERMKHKFAMQAWRVSPRVGQRVAQMLYTHRPHFEVMAEDLLSGERVLGAVPVSLLRPEHRDGLDAMVRAGTLVRQDFYPVQKNRVDVYARQDLAHVLPDLEAQVRVHRGTPTAVFDVVHDALLKSGVPPLANMLGYTERDIAYFEGRVTKTPWKRRLLGHFQESFRKARMEKMIRQGIHYKP